MKNPSDYITGAKIPTYSSLMVGRKRPVVEEPRFEGLHQLRTHFPGELTVAGISLVLGVAAFITFVINFL